MACSKFEYDHAPGAELDYGFDYTTYDWLQDVELIVTSDWTVSSTDITLSNKQIAAGVTSVFVVGGLSGKIYRLTNFITTNSVPPRKDNKTMILTCK